MVTVSEDSNVNQWIDRAMEYSVCPTYNSEKTCATLYYQVSAIVPPRQSSPCRDFQYLCCLLSVSRRIDHQVLT